MSQIYDNLFTFTLQLVTLQKSCLYFYERKNNKKKKIELSLQQDFEQKNNVFTIITRIYN